MSRNERPAPARKQAAQTQREKQKRRTDQRIRRTRYRLGQALIALIQENEKPFDQLTVKEVLDRAAVGRSTFYVHYRDKDDLLLNQFEEGLEMWSTVLSRRGEKSHRLAPVEEFFAHVASAKKLYRALIDSGRLQAFFDLGQGYFARGIEQRLKQLMPQRNLPPRELAARSYACAGNLLSLLKWWIDRGARESPRAMDELFHEMVWKGLQEDRVIG
jgi:AcrR family transcriptional regulator